jgi:hypothetical protein
VEGECSEGFFDELCSSAAAAISTLLRCVVDLHSQAAAEVRADLILLRNFDIA